MNRILLLSLGFAFSCAIQSQDTFSITAIDTITGEVGSAGASCIGAPQIPNGCYILSDVKPGTGVIHTQAYWTSANQNYASSLMDLGIPPEDMIDSLVANDAQNNPTIRQYGIIDLHDGTVRRAAYTGVNCDDYKNHILGPNYTIQGNILLGQHILDSMEMLFLATEGELACKLMAALQGAKVIGADTRCLDDGTSSLSAFLRVAQPTDDPDDLYLDLNVPSTPVGMDPIDSLQTLIDLWGGCNVSGTGNTRAGIRIGISPNPAGSLLRLKIPGTPLVNGRFLVVTGQGKTVLELNNLNGQEFTIKNELPAGFYLFVVTDECGNTGSGKLLIR